MGNKKDVKDRSEKQKSIIEIKLGPKRLIKEIIGLERKGSEKPKELKEQGIQEKD